MRSLSYEGEVRCAGGVVVVAPLQSTGQGVVVGGGGGRIGMGARGRKLGVGVRCPDRTTWHRGRICRGSRCRCRGHGGSMSSAHQPPNEWG